MDITNAYGFIVDFKNNVLRIRGEEVMLSTMTTSEKSLDVINQVAVAVPLNSEKIIFRTEEDTVKLKVKGICTETNLWMDESTLNVNGARVREN